VTQFNSFSGATLNFPFQRRREDHVEETRDKRQEKEKEQKENSTTTQHNTTAMTVTIKKAGVLGATGSVGQRFILLLSQHPQFELAAIGASARSAGKKYIDACDWKQTELMPESAYDLIVSECKADAFKDCDVVFSGLDADFAGDIEKEFVDAGLVIVSNAKNFRRDPQVPLIVPIANSDHLKMIENRVKSSGKQGYNICISNCSTAGLVAPLKPLVDQFGPLEFLSTTTLQAISGAGFSPGVSGIDILDNIVPYISGEEDKIEWEAKKILGSLNDDATDFILDEQLKVSAQCNRVAVSDGHTECVSFKFKNRPAPSVDQIKQCLKDYVCEAKILGCHSAPEHAIHVLEQPDRPQPRLDRNRDAGYGVSVGRIRPDPIFDFKMVILSHNTIIGAAGSGILIAELLAAKNLI
jgi:aspartate-semialdehyde dehydrogenase